jgi:hypothetical protein
MLTILEKKMRVQSLNPFTVIKNLVVCNKDDFTQNFEKNKLPLNALCNL